MITFNKKFFSDYLNGINEELKKIKQYGSGTVNNKIYTGEKIFPVMVKSNGSYSFMDIEIMGVQQKSTENRFKVKVLSPRSIHEELRISLETMVGKKSRNNFTVDVVIADKIEELSDVNDYFMLSEK